LLALYEALIEEYLTKNGDFAGDISTDNENED